MKKNQKKDTQHESGHFVNSHVTSSNKIVHFMWLKGTPIFTIIIVILRPMESLKYTKLWKGFVMDMIGFREFTSNDVENMTVIMKAAFDEDSTLFREVPDGPPGYDDGSFLRKYALDAKSDSFCITLNGKDIGGVIIWTNMKLTENFLGCIFIDPSLRKMGLGKKVWDKIEKMYPDTKVWRTETPLCSLRNLNFYINKCGFMAHAITDPQSYEEAQVQFVKYVR